MVLASSFAFRLAVSFLSYLQRYDSHGSQNDGDDPEAYGDLRLVDGSLGLADKIFTLWVELTLLCAEVVMDRCALEDALLHATALAELKVVDLQNDAEALDEEDAAEDGEHQFFVDYYCRHGDDAADGEDRRCTTGSL